MEAVEFLHHQVEALKKELQKKNEELEEKNQLIQFYEQNLRKRPEPVKRISDRYPAAFKPLNERKLSY